MKNKHKKGKQMKTKFTNELVSYMNTATSEKRRRLKRGR